MQLETNIDMNGGVYTASIALSDKHPLSGAEQDALTRYGDMQIDFGGTFTQVSPSLTFTLPANVRDVPSRLPVLQTFDLEDSSNANAYAVFWLSHMTGVIQTALDVLKANNPGTLGRTVVNLT